jgi:hypothetical protein
MAEGLMRRCKTELSKREACKSAAKQQGHCPRGSLYYRPSAKGREAASVAADASRARARPLDRTAWADSEDDHLRQGLLPAGPTKPIG